MVQLWSTILCMLEFCSSLFIGHSTIHMLLSSICRLAAAMLLLCLLCCWRAAAMLLLCCWWAAAMLLLCCCRAAAMLMVWRCYYAAAMLPLCCCRSAAVVTLSIICFIGFGLLYSTMPFRFELFNCILRHSLQLYSVSCWTSLSGVISGYIVHFSICRFTCYVYVSMCFRLR